MKTMLHVSVALLLAPPAALSAAEHPARPNIVLILADDLGFSDLGCYGGEIRTPTLDRLAANGVRSTRFYNSARCCPSRASLLTGQYPHAVNFPGMSGSLPDRCVTIPEALRPAGYRTLMSGKWHLGKPGPVERGFEEYFGLLAGYGSYWNPALYTRQPQDRPARSYPEGSFYATDAITDHALDFISAARKAGKPYFLYLAYNAPHFPLHARPEDIARYADVYTPGWDVIREKRYQRQKELGLVDPRWPLPPRSVVPPNPVATAHGWANKPNPAWNELELDRQADLARRMAIYAAMVDRMDQGIGRVIADLEKNGELENTLIFFLSDNGACAEWDPPGFDVLGRVDGANLGTTRGDNILHAGAELLRMGGPGTYHSTGSGWANASNTPMRLYKHYSHEGGINTPFIAHWPAGLTRKGAIVREPGHLVDLLPTCLDVAGAAYPRGEGDRAILPPEGRSLLPVLRGGVGEPRTLCFEHEGNRAVMQGKWKLVALKGKPWELYDLEADGTEMGDLADRQAERVKEMEALWEAWDRRMKAISGSKGDKAGRKGTADERR
jgi:arylsulfatase A-like enzyme